LSAAARLLDAFDRQVGWCKQAASPFSAQVLACSRSWLAGHADALSSLAAVSEDPLAAAVSLRWLSGLHHLALLGREPWASLWPPVSTGVSDHSLTDAVALAWRGEHAHMRAALANAPQTNEVQRSVALLPGLLHVAAETERPLVLNEIGSSAGLNLWCDHYRHEHGSWAWGDPAAPLQLRADWQGPPPAPAPMPATLRILERAGCDMQPVDLLQPGEDLRLMSFIWADQVERMARIRTAIGVARQHMLQQGVSVRSLRAADFVRQRLQQRRPGAAWVLMHSVVWQYIPAAEQADIRSQVEAAGAAATAESPLAWLRFEPPQPDLRVELRCRLWPSGGDRLLAVCHPHGAKIEWQTAAR
jgi:hypothetical protein